MVAGLGALALASLLVGLAPSFGGVLAARALQGFVAAALPVVTLAYLLEQMPDRLRVFGVGCMSTAFLLAGLLGQLYGAALGELSTAVLVLAAVYAVAAVLVALVPEERRQADAGEAAGGYSPLIVGWGACSRTAGSQGPTVALWWCSSPSSASMRPWGSSAKRTSAAPGWI